MLVSERSDACVGLQIAELFVGSTSIAHILLGSMGLVKRKGSNAHHRHQARFVCVSRSYRVSSLAVSTTVCTATLVQGVRSNETFSMLGTLIICVVLTMRSGLPYEAWETTSPASQLIRRKGGASSSKCADSANTVSSPRQVDVRQADQISPMQLPSRRAFYSYSDIVVSGISFLHDNVPPHERFAPFEWNIRIGRFRSHVCIHSYFLRLFFAKENEGSTAILVVECVSVPTQNQR